MHVTLVDRRPAAGGHWQDEPAVQAAALRLADVADPGLARLAELAHEPY